jgi:hypothetical protein
MLKKPFFKANQAQSPVPQIEIKAGSNTIGKNKGGGKKDKKKIPSITNYFSKLLHLHPVDD